MYGMGALQILERAVRTGAAALSSAEADRLWILAAGDSVEDQERLRNHRAATALMSAGVQVRGVKGRDE